MSSGLGRALSTPVVACGHLAAKPGETAAAIRCRRSLTSYCATMAQASPYGTRRQCSRPTCSTAAVVTLTYEYRTSHVWLDLLSSERDPHSYDLCRQHANTLSVPRGWQLTDRQGFAFGHPSDAVHRAS